MVLYCPLVRPGDALCRVSPTLRMPGVSQHALLLLQRKWCSQQRVDRLKTGCRGEGQTAEPSPTETVTALWLLGSHGIGLGEVI
jgi:hypothetical protein